MTGRIRRSFASTVRVSLISVGGALGWLALSAGAATADDGGEQGLLGSVTSVVESIATPVEPVVKEVSEPLNSAVEAVAPMPEQSADLPAVSDVVSDVPDIIADTSVVDTVAPLTGLVDSGLAQIPVVDAIVPQGTTTAITQPVLETVDSAVEPVLPPVQQAVTPVIEVIVPVAGTIDPVVEVVEPVIAPVAPVMQLPKPADVLEPVVPEVPAAVSVGPGPAEVEYIVEDEQGAVTSAAPVRLGAEPSTAGEDTSDATVLGTSVDAELSAGAEADASLRGAVHRLQGVPDIATAERQNAADPAGSPAGSVNAGATAIGSAGTGSHGAAETNFSFDLNLSPAGLSQPGFDAALPSGPSFDLSSTPD